MKKLLLPTALFVASLVACDNKDDQVVVYIDDGAITCQDDGLPPEMTQQQLMDHGIDVVDTSCGYLGSTYTPSDCGLSTNKVNIHTIHRQSLVDAQNIGFEPLEGLSRDDYIDICTLTLTSDECEEKGGQEIGDIGDGAIHQPGYRCPTNGQPPLGGIFNPGGPIAIEGAVCCGA